MMGTLRKKGELLRKKTKDTIHNASRTSLRSSRMLGPWGQPFLL
jgi:hypothetical protein